MFLQVCPVCEHRNPRGSRFCNECGSPLQLRFCPSCHAAEDVMSLECRSCGEKLPLVAVTDTVASPPDIAPLAENIWKSAPPATESFGGEDTVPVTVHGEAAGAPSLNDMFGERVVEFVRTPANTPPEPTPAPIPVFEISASDAAPATTEPQTRKPSVIELLRDTPVQAEPRAAEAPPAPPKAKAKSKRKPRTPKVDLESMDVPILESRVDPSTVTLTAESENEIEVSAEAETLVEASVVPLTYEVPDEIAAPTTAQIDDIATQLREGAWRNAMADDRTGTALAPALMRAAPVPARRLSLHRVGLVIAAVGVAVVALYSVRIAPGTSDTAIQATAHQALPPAAPAPRPEDVPAAAAVPLVVVPTAAARSIAPADATATAAPVVDPTDVKKSANVEPPAVKRSEPPVAENKPAPERRAAPAPRTETIAPAPSAQARRLPAEPSRPCTPSIAALGLCTLEASKEGK